MSLLWQLKRQLRDLENPRTLHDLHNIAGRATHEYVMDGFAREQDPYGRPWAPTKRQNPILQDTLALRDGIRWKADSRGVVIQTTGRANAYAAFHQHGTRASGRGGRGAGLPARRFLPEPGELPPQLAARLQNDFRAHLRQRYGAS
ncbi:phage virion morphogenesis protein [Deinococcus petrolearius]|uniref:Phage virion morphogenesis protein n=1 Tax=Deinococcus petrolearius TaxID=1751295 RepID=A0ABW1DGA4_9DEIO